jgi:hypothetical protein
MKHGAHESRGRLSTRSVRRGRVAPACLPLTCLLLVAPLLCGLADPLAAFAHPFHVSIAEVEFNAPRNRLEVALRLNPLDLENALRPPGGPAVDLEQTPEIDRRLNDYLKQNVLVRTIDGQTCAIHWIGKDVSLKEAWLFFEVALPADADAITFSNRALFEQQADQVNSVFARVGERRSTLRCTLADPVQQLPLR